MLARRHTFRLALAMILLAAAARADFDGFPCSTNATWFQARTVGVVSQLFEAVQERCWALTNRVSPLSIVETWNVSDGPSNTVVTVGGRVLTNRADTIRQIVTTNQVVPFTWVDSSGTNHTVYPPVTRSFVGALDAKLFELTPLFINTNLATGGSFNVWFSTPDSDHHYPTNYPYLTPSAVMRSACIGYVTNVIEDGWGNVTTGRAWFTRQPITTNAWVLWQATRQKADVTLAGCTPDVFGFNFDGDYYRYSVGEDQGFDIHLADRTSSLVPGDSIYAREDHRAVLLHLYQPGFGLDPASLWIGYGRFDYYLPPGYGVPAGWYWVLQQSIWTVDPIGTNGIAWTSSLLSTNWFHGLYDADPTPPPAPFGGRSFASSNLIWTSRTIAPFDARFYDDAPRPFWCYQSPSNRVPVSLEATGVGYIDFSDEYAGNQAGREVSESIVLTATNTPSAYRWTSVSSADLTGDAPRGATVTLLWTNQHAFGDAPYFLTAKDLDERAEYLRRLVWTSNPFWAWTNHVGVSFAGTNIDNTYTNAGHDPNVFDNRIDWEAAQPPTWGVSSWSNWVDPFVNIPWWTTSPDVYSIPGSAITNPLSGVPRCTFSWITDLERIAGVEFRTPYVERADILVDWDDLHLFNPWWPGAFDVVKDNLSGEPPTQTVHSCQSWDGITVSAIIQTTNADVRRAHADDFYVRPSTSTNARYGYLCGTDAGVFLTSTSALVSCSGPDRQNIPSSTHSVDSSESSGQRPYLWPFWTTNRWVTDASNTSSTLLFGNSITVTNIIRLDDYYENAAPPPAYVFSGSQFFFPLQQTPTGQVWNGSEYVPNTTIPYSTTTFLPVSTNSTGYVATVWQTLPRATDPLTPGIDCWYSVSTNISTQSVEIAQIVWTNISVWARNTTRGAPTWPNPWTNSLCNPLEWQDFVTNTVTNTFTTNIVHTNVSALLVRWDAPVDGPVAYSDFHLWHADQRQLQAIATNDFVHALDPIQRWNVPGGFRRK